MLLCGQQGSRAQQVLRLSLPGPGCLRGQREEGGGGTILPWLLLTGADLGRKRLERQHAGSGGPGQVRSSLSTVVAWAWWGVP